MINNQKILLKFIQTNKNVDYVYISYFYILSENFIREFKDKIDWKYISIYQKLSENFIEEFQDKVNWDYISKYQTLSENFKKNLNINLY